MPTQIEKVRDFKEYNPPLMVRGADWQGFSIKFKENDRTTIINVTDYDATMEMYDSANGTVYDTLTGGDGIAITGASGLFTISRTAAEVAAYEWKTAQYKLIITDDGGTARCYVMGKLEIRG